MNNIECIWYMSIQLNSNLLIFYYFKVILIYSYWVLKSIILLALNQLFNILNKENSECKNNNK